MNPERTPERAPEPRISLGQQGSGPIPSRWLEVPIVSARWQAWTGARASWEAKLSEIDQSISSVRERLGSNHEAQVQHPGDTGRWLRHEDQQLNQTLEGLQADRLRVEEEHPPRLPEDQVEAWLLALTPQGPILVRDPLLLLAEDGPQPLLRLNREGAPAERLSLVHLLQWEPVQQEQAKSWYPWALTQGDVYLIP